MAALAIDNAIEKVPFLAGSKNVKKTPLSGGITNLNFKVDADGKSYVIRLAGEGTEQLGIKRDVEYAANYAAGQMGIAPEVVYFIEPENYIVTRFVNGKVIPPDVIKQPDYLARVAKKIRLFHKRAPKLKGEFNVFRRVEMLTKISKKNNAKFPHDWDWIMQKTKEIEKALLKDPYIPTPCHIFLYEYFGEVTDKQYARLRLMWPMSELHESMWGTTQTGISKLEEDFQGYADLWFGRVRQHMTDFRWEQWLKDAGKKSK
jgi:thiamine kinase-like enzyme